jgi:hypothetical protein
MIETVRAGDATGKSVDEISSEASTELCSASAAGAARGCRVPRSQEVRSAPPLPPPSWPRAQSSRRHRTRLTHKYVIQQRPVPAKSGAKEPAARPDDPVRMYLREMGSVELLSREGEIAIAKRIEAGRSSATRSIDTSPDRIFLNQ